VGSASTAPVTTEFGWTSQDGRVWERAGKLGEDLPAASVLADDGERIVIFGRESAVSDQLGAWISTDGTTWSQAPFSGSDDVPLASSGVDDRARITGAWMVPGGVIVSGSGPQLQVFWFASWVEPEG